MLDAITDDNDVANVRLTWITRMFSPVSFASCSRIWRVGLGVAANAAFSVSSCLALIVVRGPRRLAPRGIAPPPAVSDALPGLPAETLPQSPLSSAKFSLSPPLLLLLLLLLLVTDEEEEQGDDAMRAALTPQSTRVGVRSVDVGAWRSTTQREIDESSATRRPASASGVQAASSSVQSFVAVTCLSATPDDWYVLVTVAVVASSPQLSSTSPTVPQTSSSSVNADSSTTSRRLLSISSSYGFFLSSVAIYRRFILCTVLGQIGDLNLTGAKIGSFRSAYWFRSAILIHIPNPIPNPIPKPSRSEPNNFSFNSLLSFRSPIWSYNYPYFIVEW